MQKDPPLVAITTVVSGVAERERKRGREFSGPWTASNLALSLSFSSDPSLPRAKTKEHFRRRRSHSRRLSLLRALLLLSSSSCSTPPGFSRRERTLDGTVSPPLSPFSSPLPSVSWPRKAGRGKQQTNEARARETRGSSRGRLRDGARVHFRKKAGKLQRDRGRSLVGKG